LPGGASEPACASIISSSSGDDLRWGVVSVVLVAAAIAVVWLALRPLAAPPAGQQRPVRGWRHRRARPPGAAGHRDARGVIAVTVDSARQVAGAPVTGTDFCSVYPDLSAGLALAICVVVILPTGVIASPLVMTMGVGA
jgi:hypothetical protein